MFPVLPSKIPPELDQLILDVTTESAALGHGIHPHIVEEIARFMVKVNSFYTNGMEGNPSKLKDIEAALNKTLSKDKTARNNQKEHLAHIEVQEAMLRRLKEEPGLRICSEEFLCWIHREFYDKLPAEMRFALTKSDAPVPVIPGELRDRGISVGRHDAPLITRDEVRDYLQKFEEHLSPEKLTGSQKLLGMASSHHRFLWIHPFPDGNGRVARLMSIAYAYKIGIGTNMLWTVTRAFARQRATYDASLDSADQERRYDWDGRGPLSEENLIGFCIYYLECCKDQIEYMDGVLSLTGLERRYRHYVDGIIKDRVISKAAGSVMEKLLLQGGIPRSQVQEICDVKQRRASDIIKELINARLVRSESAYGALRLNISTEMSIQLFPGLAS